MESTILAAGASMMGKLTANGMLYDLTEVESSLSRSTRPIGTSR